MAPTPGRSFGGLAITLDLDAYALHTATNTNAAPLAQSLGVLTVSGTTGTATASFSLAPGFDPSLVGLTLHHAYLSLSAGTGWLTAVSNPVPLTLEP